MKGLPDPVRFALTRQDVERVRTRILDSTSQTFLVSPFYWLSTLDGKQGLISLPDIDLANFLFEIEHPITAMIRDSQRQGKLREREDKFAGTVDLYFRGRAEGASIVVENSPELKQIFEMLAGKKNTGQLPGFVRFTDSAGQVIAFRPQRLMLLVAHRGSIQMTSDAEYEALFNP
jgi:hypothetical protein